MLSYFLILCFVLQPSLGCNNEFDCSLGGKCVNSKCECDPTWTSDYCDVLNLLPTNNYKALYRETESSWGGSVVYDKTTDTYHMYTSDMAYNCTLNEWETNSRILHAISKSNPEGPYQPQKVVVPIWAHNPTIHFSEVNNNYVIYHIGQGVNHGTPINCSQNASKMINDAQVWPTSANAAVSNNGNLDTFTEQNSASGDWAFNNPAALIFKNGTTLMISKIGCNASLNISGYCAQMAVSIGPSYKGPFELVKYINVYGEDPYIWQDPNGYFHMIWQSGSYKGTPDDGYPGHWHTAFSYNGFDWKVANRTQAFDNNIMLTNGTKINVGRRERHQILFNDLGWPSYLFNGCGSTSFSFTSVQPINTQT